MKYRIREWREERGLSRRELAEGANISVEYLRRLEQGNAWPSGKLIVSLARELGCLMDDLVVKQDQNAISADQK